MPVASETALNRSKSVASSVSSVSSIGNPFWESKHCRKTARGHISEWIIFTRECRYSDKDLSNIAIKSTKLYAMQCNASTTSSQNIAHSCCAYVFFFTVFLSVCWGFSQPSEISANPAGSMSTDSASPKVSWSQRPRRKRVRNVLRCCYVLGGKSREADQGKVSKNDKDADAYLRLKPNV